MARAYITNRAVCVGKGVYNVVSPHWPIYDVPLFAPSE